MGQAEPGGWADWSMGHCQGAQSPGWGGEMCEGKGILMVRGQSESSGREGRKCRKGGGRV